MSDHVPTALEDKVRELEAAEKALAKVDDKRLQEKILDAQAQDRSAARGWLGRVFGDHAHASANIAGFVVVSMVVIICIIIVQPSGRASAIEIVQTLGAFLTLALGYLFGRKS